MSWGTENSSKYASKAWAFLSKTAFKFLILLWWVCVVLKGLTLDMCQSHEKGVCKWKVFALEVPVHYDCFLAHQFGHLMVAQNLIIFMIIIGLWTSHHFFSHSQSVTSSHGNVYQYIIFRKLLDCIFNSILLTFIWCQYSYQLTQLCLGCQGIMGYICNLSEILNIIYIYIYIYIYTHTHTHTHTQENMLIHYCYKLLFPWYAGLKAGHL